MLTVIVSSPGLLRDRLRTILASFSNIYVVGTAGGGLSALNLLILILVIAAGGVGLFPSAGVSPALAQENMETDTQGNPASEPQPVTVPETITFSQDSTVTHHSFQLTMESLVGGTIHYTTNGSLPAAGSIPYTGPITIDAPTVIRAQVFDDQGTPQRDPVTKSYIVAPYDPTIPVISIVTDWANLDALHANPKGKGREWERPINLEYFAPGGEVQFNIKAGLRIHGGESRTISPKKSYRLYFRKSYGGPGNLEYPLFPDSPVTRFDKLVLRGSYNDSFAYVNTTGQIKSAAFLAKYIGDQVVRNLHRDMGQPIAHGSWVLLYLNGEFWGLYDLTERIGLQFLRSYSDKDSDWDIIKKDVGVDAEGRWYNIERAIEGGDGA